MNFGRESWRKLYVAESMQHRLLPLLCRGLRDYLLRYAAEDGTLLARTDDPAHDLAKALGSHPEEIGAVAGFVETWLADGFLTHKRGRLTITRYAEAQSARSPGAERQARYRDRSSDVTRDATVTSPSDARATSQKTRRDETRKEEILPPVGPPAGDTRPKGDRRKAPKPQKWARFPPDWVISADCAALALELGLSAEAERQKILDHEFKTPRSDPEATFRTWLRNATTFARPPGFVQHQQHQAEESRRRPELELFKPKPVPRDTVSAAELERMARGRA